MTIPPILFTIAALAAAIGIARAYRQPDAHPAFYWICAAGFIVILDGVRGGR